VKRPVKRVSPLPRPLRAILRLLGRLLGRGGRRLGHGGHARVLAGAALLTLAACALPARPAVGVEGAPGSPAAAERAPDAADGWDTLPVAGGVEIAYRVVGRGEPTVVVPAGTIVGDVEPLAARHRVVLYDPRGRGRSTRYGPELAVSLEHDLADLEALRAALGLERIALLGISYYGAFVALYAAERPERVERLVMAGPMAPSAESFAGGWEPEAEAEKAAADAAAEAELAALRAEGLEAADPAAYCRAYYRAYAPGLYADPERFDPASVAASCELPNERPASLSAWAGALFGALGEWDFAERLHGVRAPALILQGRQDRRTPPAGAGELAATIPDARVLWIDDCGHVPLKERPEVAYPAVLEFLAGAWPEAAAHPAGP